MFRFLVLFLAFALSAGSVAAQEFEELEIVREAHIDGQYVELYMQDTVRGRPIICGLYDEAGALVALQGGITHNLASSVLFLFDPASYSTARCVYDD